MKNYRIIFSKKFKQKRILFCVISILLSFIIIIVESFTQKFIDAAVTAHMEYIMKSAILLLLSYSFISILFYRKNKIENYMEKKGNFEGQIDIYQKLLKKDMSFFKERETGVLLYNITNDLYEAVPWYSYGKIQCSLEIINLLIIFIFMMYTEIYLSLVVVILIALSMLLANKISMSLGKRINEKQKINADINQFMIETMKSMGSIVQLNKRQYFADKYNRYMEEKYKPAVNHVVINQALYISQLVNSQEMIPFLVLFIGLIFTIGGKSTIGTTIIMMSLTIKMSKSIQQVGDLLSKKHASQEIFNRMKEIYVEQEIDSNEVITRVENFERMTIRIDAYKFSDGEEVLKSCMIDIKKNDLISIKGASGKGKTTLMNLISRFLYTDELNGSILYNGIDISKLPRTEYYKHVLQVEQSTVLIEGTLEENLLLGDHYTKEEVEEVIFTCKLDLFKSARGMDCYIKENARNISGGEKQRIGLARILLRKPDLLILDEVTSALNEEIRDEVVKRIIAYKNKYQITIIAISHNDDFIQYCNKCYQL